MTFLFVDRQFVGELKEKLSRREGIWAKVAKQARDAAEERMSWGPWSPTFFPALAASKDPHDYYSEAPYYWPDPANPEGPYIRRDGYHNPHRFLGIWQGLRDLSQAVIFLTNAGYYLGEKAYLDRANLLVRTWFVEEQTRMNPHMNYGEAIKGICEGRNAGIIAVRQIDRIVHAVTFLEEFPEYQDTVQSMKVWCAKFLAWLTTSEIGLSEKKANNNHGLWWAAHVATLAAFVGNEEQFQMALDRYRQVIIPEQIAEDGSLPKELARSRSLYYSLYNFQAHIMLCELAYHRGIDLWHYQSPEGRGFELAVRFLMPYLDNPFEWKHPQIDGIVPYDTTALQLASIRLGMPECNRVNIKRRGETPLVKYHEEPLGPIAFLPGFSE
jgi:hypothetical protein